MVTGPSSRPLRVLWVSTKSPWPTIDGGRLVQALTLEALASLGHQVRVLCPESLSIDAADPPVENLALESVAVRPRSKHRTLLASLWHRRPFTIEKHNPPEMRRAIQRRLQSGDWDLVHVEQLHALMGVLDAQSPIPVVLRQQNVESDLWSGAGRLRRGLGRTLFRWEGQRLRRFEAWALGRVQRVMGLTTADAAQLKQLAPSVEPLVVTAPFPPTLASRDRTFQGSPALVILARGDWPPNRDGVEAFLREIWPALKSRMPQAELHLFGMTTETRPGLTCYPSPADSSEAFHPDSIFLVPLRLASGIRMKILEAWARGVPVVASTEAAGELGLGQPQALASASGMSDWITAIEKIEGEATYREGLLAGGRQRLARDHDPVHIARQIAEVWREAVKP